MFRVLLAGAILAGAASVAQAVVIERNLTVTAADFFAEQPAFDPVKIQFQVRFDNSSDVSATSSGLTIIQDSVGVPLRYAYLTQFDLFTLGTGPLASGSADTTQRGFGLFVQNFSTLPNADFASLTAGDGSPQSISSVITIAENPITSDVPEPSSWALMILGVGMVGATMRRHRRVKTFVSNA